MSSRTSSKQLSTYLTRRYFWIISLINYILTPIQYNNTHNAFSYNKYNDSILRLIWNQQYHRTVYLCAPEEYYIHDRLDPSVSIHSIQCIECPAQLLFTISPRTPSSLQEAPPSPEYPRKIPSISPIPLTNQHHSQSPPRPNSPRSPQRPIFSHIILPLPWFYSPTSPSICTIKILGYDESRVETMACRQSQQFCRYQECAGTGFIGKFGGDRLECIFGIGARWEVKGRVKTPCYQCFSDMEFER